MKVIAEIDKPLKLLKFKCPFCNEKIDMTVELFETGVDTFFCYQGKTEECLHYTSTVISQHLIGFFKVVPKTPLIRLVERLNEKEISNLA